MLIQIKAVSDSSFEISHGAEFVPVTPPHPPNHGTISTNPGQGLRSASTGVSLCDGLVGKNE
jgi:hypothetical protein